MSIVRPPGGCAEPGFPEALLEPASAWTAGLVGFPLVCPDVQNLAGGDKAA